MGGRRKVAVSSRTVHVSTQNTRSKVDETTKLDSVKFASLGYLGISAAAIVGASAAGTFPE